MREICGEFFIFHQGNVPVCRACETINLLKRDICVHFTRPFTTQNTDLNPVHYKNMGINATAGIASSWCGWTEAALNRCLASLWKCSRISQISVSYISQGSAATHLRCDGQCDMGFDANFSENTTVKEFWKSINICRSYKRMYSGTVFLGKINTIRWKSVPSITRTAKYEVLTLL